MMGYASSPGNYRRLTFFLAIFALLQNAGTAYLLHRLPDDPMDMSSHLSYYSWFAVLLAFLGVIGAKKENATLVAIFANYILIDVILCSIPRLLTLFFFPEIRGSICSRDSINARLQTLQARGFFTTAENQVVAEQEMMAECVAVVSVLQMLAGVVVALFTFMQVLLAIQVRKYSSMLQNRQDIEETIGTISQPDLGGKKTDDACLPPYKDEIPIDEKKLVDA